MRRIFTGRVFRLALIWNTNDRRFQYARVRRELCFYLGGVNILAAGNIHVFKTPHDVVIAVFILAPEVAAA